LLGCFPKEVYSLATGLGVTQTQDVFNKFGLVFNQLLGSCSYLNQLGVLTFDLHIPFLELGVLFLNQISSFLFCDCVFNCPGEILLEGSELGLNL
jgi:hypothetical protein